MPLDLPVTDRALVDACAAELSAAAAEPASAAGRDDAEHRGGAAESGAVEAARLRFAWALAHSASQDDVLRARELLESWLAKGGPQRREPLYLLAVACFRSGHVADAKRWAATALAVAPTCHQSEALRQACDEQLAEDALLAAGVAGVAGVGLALLAGVLMAGARRRPS